MAGVTHDDISTLMIYDNFTPTVLFSLEGLRLLRRGRERAVRRRRPSRARRPLSGQHLGRPSLRILHAGLGAQSRGGAQVRGAVRRAAGEGLRLRALHGGRAGRHLDHLRQGAVMRPLPQTDGADAPFWQALRRREVRVQRCDDLRHASLPGDALLRALPLRRERMGRGRADAARWRPGACSTGRISRTCRCPTR